MAAPRAGGRPTPPGLVPFWDGTLATFASLDPPALDAGMKERHRAYSLLLMAIMSARWNGNKYGEVGDYGAWRTDQLLTTGADGTKVYAGGSYLGHNIAAIAVDATGRVIDFEFNHNDLFDSSVEHAESRLVRRVFALNQVYSPWSDDGRVESPTAGPPHQLFATAVSRPDSVGGQAEVVRGYSSLLTDVTIYTSLESCAQCSGIMTLAGVRQVVYLQWDQGEFLVGNMMYQATAGGASGFRAPLPVPAAAFGFEYFDQLNAGNDEFCDGVAGSPFYTGPATAEPVASPSITSYLCTDGARGIYAAAAAELTTFSMADPTHIPPGSTPGTLTNSSVLAEAKRFREYATAIGNRGTPHRV